MISPMQNNEVLELDMKSLFSNSGKYMIPVYQRNYSWGEAEITQLIQDLLDSQKQDAQRSYYLGTLVVYERNEKGLSTYETIDGQQRLTTLSILMAVLKNDWKAELENEMSWLTSLNLNFKSRKSSTVLLDRLFTNGNLKGIDYNKSSNIAAAYDLTKKQLKKLLDEEKTEIGDFVEYLLSHVKILRVPVPYDTNLNHYFEIMNTRGEQLEKHEIVKAKLLEAFADLPLAERNIITNTFNSIWDATSDMEKYMQYAFTIEQRISLFGGDDWGNLEVDNFDDLNLKIGGKQEVGKGGNTLSIDEIIMGQIKSKKPDETEDIPVRFYSVVNFENFLLHVLRLMKGASKDIPLDDKRLISIFDKELKDVADKVRFVKEFCFELFRTKFLFDKYIVKREFIGGKDHWSLKRLKRYDGSKASYINTFGSEDDTTSKSDNRKLIMLLSMFHVSTPTMVYKHWLSAVLKFPYIEADPKGAINSSDYIDYLEQTVNLFVLGRHLRSEDSLEYHDMIFKRETIPPLTWEQVDEKKLTFGNISNNLVFNYIDYLYWKTSETNDDKIIKYEFSYRSSVEHYYPQNPMEGGVKKLTTPEDIQALNCIGNLCLISHSKNSRLSNFSPLQKIEFYSNNIDSIKQYLMIKKGKDWNVASIREHEQEIIHLLKSTVL